MSSSLLINILILISYKNPNVQSQSTRNATIVVKVVTYPVNAPLAAPEAVVVGPVEEAEAEAVDTAVAVSNATNAKVLVTSLVIALIAMAAAVVVTVVVVVAATAVVANSVIDARATDTRLLIVYKADSVLLPGATTVRIVTTLCYQSLTSHRRSRGSHFPRLSVGCFGRESLLQMPSTGPHPIGVSQLISKRRTNGYDKTLLSNLETSKVQFDALKWELIHQVIAAEDEYHQRQLLGQNPDKSSWHRSRKDNVLSVESNRVGSRV